MHHRRAAVVVALICVATSGLLEANQPPPSFCDRNPQRCPPLSNTEQRHFENILDRIERALPRPKGYKREVRRIGPGTTGYGRAGSAFPQELIEQATYFTDPKAAYETIGVIEVTPMPVASFHTAGGTKLVDRSGWLVVEYKPGHPSHPKMTRFEIVIGKRAGEGTPQQYPSHEVPNPAAPVRAIHIGILGPDALARALVGGLDAKALRAIVAK